MNSTNSASPNMSDSSSANTISLAAAILAAGAFIIAFAQALLQYFSSSESRNKCTFSAIDVSSKQVKFGWSWKFWKLRVYYPVLDFDFQSILLLQLEASLKNAIDSPKSPLEKIRKKHGWHWRSVMEKDEISRRTIAYVHIQHTLTQ